METLFKTKLPRWVQRKLDSLQRERDDAVGQLKAFMDDQAESKVFARGHALSLQDKHWIQSDEVTFCLPESEVSVQIDGDGLMIRSNGGQCSRFVPVSRM